MRRYFLRSMTALAAAMLPAVVATAAPQPMPAEEQASYDDLKNHSNEWFKERLRGPQDVVDGMTLHPKIQYHLEKFTRNGPQPDYGKVLVSPEAVAKMRASVDSNWAGRTMASAPMRKTEDRTVAGPGGPLDIRIYWPEVTGRSDEKLPVLLYLHGGGWLFGSVEALDPAARMIANHAQAIVVSGNYRLTPENRFPAAQDDALALFRWVRDHAGELGGDPSRVAIGGDSAGGQMSVVTSLRLRDLGEKGPAYQLLFYPAADIRANSGYASLKSLGSNFGLDIHFADYIRSTYFPDVQQRANPDASPLLAKSFRDMPPTLIGVGGFDMLRDEGKELANRLRADGVPATYLLFPSLIHGFLQHSYAVDDAQTASLEMARIFGEQVRALKPR